VLAELGVNRRSYAIYLKPHWMLTIDRNNFATDRLRHGHRYFAFEVLS
jgi:hypothetical protein